MKRVAVICAVLSVFISAPASTDECYSYPDTVVTYYADCRCYACADYGDGCTACTNGSDTCYTNGVGCTLEPTP